MLIHEILDTSLKPLKLNDTISSALNSVDLFRVSKYVVLDEENHIAGMANVDELVSADDINATLRDIHLDFPIFIRDSQHVFEAARQMINNDLFLIPVIDSTHKYAGMVRKKDILNALGEIFNLSSTGSVLTIEMEQIDFTLSDMVRIIETEGARILGVAVEQPSSTSRVYKVSVKLNVEDSSLVSSSLRRFGYEIISDESSEVMEFNFSDKADELIRYLDI